MKDFPKTKKDHATFIIVFRRQGMSVFIFSDRQITGTGFYMAYCLPPEAYSH
jgi:hypothetical protein